MFSFTELRGQSSLDAHGTVRWNTTYVSGKKPLWLVALKLAVLAGMVGLATAILVPLLVQILPLWKAAAATIGILLIYIGVAFFCRPECNGDNMGWFGGMANDPFQYSDNINRFLFQLHMLLGPGRFAAETMLDTCALMGLARGAEVAAEEELPRSNADHSANSLAAGDPYALPAAAPRSDRFDQPRSDGARR